jgi:hypothetical protein
MSTLRERLFNAIWRCGFAPDEDPQLVELKKFDWPDDVACEQKRADAALSAFRAWLEAEGLVVVPRDSTMQMCQQGDCTTAMAFEGGYQCEAEAVWDRMITAAPDALKGD